MRALRAITIVVVMMSLLVMTTPLTASAGPPAKPNELDWGKTYGGEKTDTGAFVQETADSGYVVMGNTYSFGTSGFYLLKTNSTGELSWSKTYPVNSLVRTGLVTSDGGFVLAGAGMAVVRTDSSGNMLWYRNYEGQGLGLDGVSETPDGGLILTGYSSTESNASLYSLHVLRTDVNGEIIWEREISNDDYGLDGQGIEQTEDGNYLIAGIAHQPQQTGLFLLSLTDSGETQWLKIFDLPDSQIAYSINKCSTNGYVIAGRADVESPQSGTTSYASLYRIDDDGTLLWYKSFGGTWGSEGYDATETEDGGFILVGWTIPQPNSPQVTYIVRTDPNGELCWEKTYGEDRFFSVSLTSDGGYITVGQTWTPETLGDVYLLKLKPSEIYAEGAGSIIPETGESASLKLNVMMIDGLCSGVVEFRYVFDGITLVGDYLLSIDVYSWDTATIVGIADVSGIGSCAYLLEVTDGSLSDSSDFFRITIWNGLDMESSPDYIYEGELVGGNLKLMKS